MTLEMPGININIAPKEIYEILCPDCQEKVRDMTRGKIREMLLEKMVEDMTDKVLVQVLPQAPKRQLQPKRELRPKR